MAPLLHTMPHQPYTTDPLFNHSILHVTSSPSSKPIPRHMHSQHAEHLELHTSPKLYPEPPLTPSYPHSALSYTHIEKDAPPFPQFSRQMIFPLQSDHHQLSRDSPVSDDALPQMGFVYGAATVNLRSLPASVPAVDSVSPAHNVAPCHQPAVLAQPYVPSRLRTSAHANVGDGYGAGDDAWHGFGRGYANAAWRDAGLNTGQRLQVGSTSAFHAATGREYTGLNSSNGGNQLFGKVRAAGVNVDGGPVSTSSSLRGVPRAQEGRLPGHAHAGKADTQRTDQNAVKHNAGSAGVKSSKGGSQQRSSHGSTVREYNRKISACARKRDLDGALRALHELDAAPSLSRNVYTYNAVINAFLVCGRLDKAHSFWQEMEQTGIQPSLITYNTMLKSCFGGTDEDVERAFRLLGEMEVRGIKADRVTFNSVINACVSAGRIHDAQTVYEQMRKLDIEPDAYTFCTLAKQARHHQDVKMLDTLLLHQMHHHSALVKKSQNRPDGDDMELSKDVSPVAYNTLADAYIRCGYPSRALALLERIGAAKKESGNAIDWEISLTSAIPVHPDAQTFNVRLKALRESGASVSAAFDVVEEMKLLGLDPDHITLLTLADLCCRREEMTLAEEVLRTATEADIMQFNQGFLGGNNSRRGRMSNKSTRQGGNSSKDGLQNVNGKKGHDSMKNLSGRGTGYRRNDNQPVNAKANAALFNALIRGYSTLEPPNVKAALALYRQMRRCVQTYKFTWYEADAVTYTMLVDGFARTGDAAGAEMIISEMELAGRANVVAYNAYLKANRTEGYAAALSVLQRMKRAGLSPDIVSYNTMIDVLASEENGTKIAEELVKVDMPRNGVDPDLQTFNTLLKGFARTRGSRAEAAASLQSAYQWFSELKNRGLTPDEFTYQSMVSACAAAGETGQALEFFRMVEAERVRRVLASGEGATIRLDEYNKDLSVSIRGSAQVTGKSSPNLLDESTSDFDYVTRRVSDVSLGTEQTQKTSNDWMLLPHPTAYIALMRAFLSSNAKDRVDSVLHLRDEMVARGLELGHTGYATVADAYATRGDYESVEATLHEMVARSNKPYTQMPIGPVHHCIRMKALCNAGRLDDAISILSNVDEADIAMFNQLIFACARKKDMTRMITVLKAMESFQVKPDAVTHRAFAGMMKIIAQKLHSFDQQVSQRLLGIISKIEEKQRLAKAVPRTSWNVQRETNDNTP